MINVTTLSSGLRVATDTIANMETVTLGLWAGVGTRHEEEADNGVAHLVEHMLFKGTARRSAFDISSQMEDVGGHLNAYTTRESTAYYAKVLKADAPLAADILCDMLQNAALDEEELDRERGVIIQEIGQSLDQPDDVIFDLAARTAYPDSGMGRPVLGTADIIRRLPKVRMQHYIRAHYAAPQIIFAASGAITHEAHLALAEQHLSNLGTVAQTKKDKARFQSGDVREARDIEQLHAVISFNGITYHDPDYFAVSVLSTLLGGGMSSRLFQEVREKRGLVYSIYSYASAHSDGGQFGIYAGTDPQRIQELLPVVAQEMHKVTHSVSEAEVKRAKAQLRASILMAQESTMSRAEKLAYNLLMFNRIIPADEIQAKIEAVTAADITRIAANILKIPPVTAFVGPLDQVPAGDAVATLFAA